MDKINLRLSHAIKADVAAFAGTQVDLSREVCGSNQGLRHKIANVKGQALHPAELVRLQQVSGSRHVIQEMARTLGGVFVSLPSEIDADSSSSSICIALGDLHRAMRDAQADGVISDNERVDLENKAQWTISAMLSWLYGCLGGVIHE